MNRREQRERFEGGTSYLAVALRRKHDMLIPDLDIYRSAQVLVKHHGEDAPIHAAMRADELLEAGDLDGYAVWKRIIKAAENLLSKERPAGVTVQ